MKSFDIEYEIPPMRAIYHISIDGVKDEQMARDFIAEKKPDWRIRKLTEIQPEKGSEKQNESSN